MITTDAQALSRQQLCVASMMASGVAQELSAGCKVTFRVDEATQRLDGASYSKLAWCNATIQVARRCDSTQPAGG